jgi:quercetin dioxygenase-like cupin family protein
MNAGLSTPYLSLCAGVLLAPLIAAAGDMSATPVMLTSDQLEWIDNPRVPGLGLARILGNEKEAGPYTYRVKFPEGRVVEAHSHPDDRMYTVISGTWYIGWGEEFDESKLTALPAGSFYTEPAGVPHFISTPDGEAIVQISGTGPTAASYVDAGKAPAK